MTKYQKLMQKCVTYHIVYVRTYDHDFHHTHSSANMPALAAAPRLENIVVVPTDDAATIKNPNYNPVSLETVRCTYIDKVEITE